MAEPQSPGEVLLEMAQAYVEQISDGEPMMVSGAVLVVTVMTTSGGHDSQLLHSIRSADLPLWTAFGMLEAAQLDAHMQWQGSDED